MVRHSRSCEQEEAIVSGDVFCAPDHSHSALVTIDVQTDTLDGQPLEIPGTSQILPRLRELTRAFRDVGRTIVHAVRIYRSDGSNVDLCRRQEVSQGAPWLKPETPGVQLARELFESPIWLDCERLLAGRVQEVGPEEYVIYKPRWGAFFQTPLEQLLRPKDINTLVFAGCNFPNCPRTSIYEASERDFRLVLATDAISGLYNRGATEMRNIGVQLQLTSDIIAAFRRPMLIKENTGSTDGNQSGD